MPRDFSRRGDVSMVQLLEESGYIQRRNEIDEDKIAEYLKDDKSIVDDWIRYSENQRGTPSWYFDGQRVGYLDENGKSEKQSQFGDPLEGCALYIKKEMEELFEITTE
jgi:hypothetical protein